MTITDFSANETFDSRQKILPAILLSAFSIFTIGGNTIVLKAFYLEKKLRNTFTSLIANLAVTDFLVGVTSMVFYTFDTVLGFWPFGQFMCGVWMFFDFCTIFASILTLVAISIDR